MAKKRSSGRRFKAVRLGVAVAAAVVVVGGLYGLHRFQVDRQAGVFKTRAADAVAQSNWGAAAGFYQTYLNFRPRDVDAMAEYAGALEHVVRVKPAATGSLIGVYETLLKYDAARSDVRLKLARHYVDVRYYPAARTHLAALRADPNPGTSVSELWELEAQCDEGERKFPQAAEDLRTAIKAGQATPKAVLRLALILKAEVRTPDAEQEATQVVDQYVSAHPADPKAHYVRASYRLATGDRAGAKDDLDFARRNVPGGATDPDIVLALTAFAETMADLRDAEGALGRAIDANKADSRLKLALADVQTRMNEPEEAAKTLAVAASEAGTADLSVVPIADRLIDLGKLGEAAAQAGRLGQNAQQGVFHDYLLGEVRAAEGNWPAAVSLLRAAADGGLKRYPAYLLRARLALAACYDQAHDVDLRLRELNAALAVNPKSIAAQLGRAECLAQMGELRPAIDAYRPLATQVPAARAALSRLLLAEVVARPEKDRVWGVVDDAIGPDPLPPALAVVKADSLLVRRRRDDAVRMLTDAIKAAPNDVDLRVAYSTVLGPDAGLKALDDAEKLLGQPVKLRLTRARLLAAAGTADPAAVAALGRDVNGLDAKDRFLLLSGLGQVCEVAGRRRDAIDLYKRAAAERPFDLSTRTAVFDLAAAEKDGPLQEEMLADVGRIDGPDGPVRVVLDASRVIPAVTPGDKDRVADLRTKLKAAQAKRPAWGRVDALLGDLDRLDGNADGAVDHYRRAVARGEAPVPLLRAFVGLLLERRGYLEALDVLGRRARLGGLPADLLQQLAVLQSSYGQDAAESLGWARSKVAADSPDYRDHLLRAAVLAANNDLADARRALDRALALDDAAPDVWENLVRFLASTGNGADAEAAAKRAAETLRPAADAKPEVRAAAEAALGSCRELLGDNKGAEERYRAAVAALPTDVAANRHLAALLQRTGRRADAEDLLAALARSPAPVGVRLWARRELALSKVSRPDGYAEREAALGLVELNLNEGGNRLDDQRAKAFVLAVDPFRGPEAIALLAESAKAVPLTADQAYHLARLCLQQGQPDKAEAALRDATRATAVAAPEHLALLAKVQLDRKNPVAARATVAHLKSLAPRSWEAVAAEARVLAADGKPAEAGALVTKAVAAAGTDFLAAVAGPLLEEIGCAKDAETLFAKAADRPDAAAAHVPLGAFYLRAGRADDARALALRRKATAPPGVTAKLLSGAARVRPARLLPEPDRAAAEAATREAAEWVDGELARTPNDPDLLFAKAELDDARERYDDAIRGYEAAVERAPDSVAARNNLAMLLALHKRDGGDVPQRHLAAAMARSGPRPATLDTRAYVHLVGGRSKPAADDLTVAINLDPKPAYLFHLALVYDRQADAAPDPDLPRRRNDALNRAFDRGLTKAMLHPKEWPDFDRLKAEAGR